MAIKVRACELHPLSNDVIIPKQIALICACNLVEPKVILGVSYKRIAEHLNVTVALKYTLGRFEVVGDSTELSSIRDIPGSIQLSSARFN